MGMRHLVTGGAGFIGSHLAEALPGEVIVVDNLSGGWRDNLPDRIQFIKHDLVDGNTDGLVGVLQPTHIWHLAAYAAEGLSHWVRGHNVLNNWYASTRLINAAVKHGVERFTFTSSMAVYGTQPVPYTETMWPRPEDPYGIAKHAVEQDLAAAGQVLGLDYVIVRPHNVYGPRQNLGDPYRNVVGIFMRQALAGRPVTVFGDGTQTRAFSYITDIVRPLVNTLEAPSGSLFNIGGEEVVTIEELAWKVANRFDVGVQHLPARYEVKHAWCDHARAREQLGFTPKVGFDEGLDRMAEWARTTRIRWSQTPDRELETNLPEVWKQW